jgi:antitoxin (DNA-binding transcriptional repressor) of toxin-antitoxin stability system
MVKVTIKEAQSKLPDLISAVLEGEKVLIQTEENHRIELVPLKKQSTRKFGCAKGLIEISDDFDEPLDDFKTYIQ